MPSLVSRSLREWTAGLNPIQARISLFVHVRDIPYSLAVPMTDPVTAPERVLALGKGYCGPKHYLLAALFRQLDLDVVYASFPFRWNDPDLQYPPELRTLAAGMPGAHHLACRVRIDDRWVLVDATWDRPLSAAGFPVNEHWDGFSDMKCAVKPLRPAERVAGSRIATNPSFPRGGTAAFNPLDGEQDHGDEDAHAAFYHRKVRMRTPEEIGRIARFYPEFDAWLERVRG
jgi:transglutaminase-like putative cysteine protease